MKAVLQRITRGTVTINGKKTARTEGGLVVFLGIKKGDSDREAEYLAKKIVNLRIFDDDRGKMNRSIQDIGGTILLVSQFTLYGDCKKGLRPSYTLAEEPQRAKKLYEHFIRELTKHNIPFQTGIFQERMLVSVDIEGPVTIILETP